MGRNNARTPPKGGYTHGGGTCWNEPHDYDSGCCAELFRKADQLFMQAHADIVEALALALERSPDPRWLAESYRRLEEHRVELSHLRLALRLSQTLPGGRVSPTSVEAE